ncbi:DNA replication factor Cdt1 [Culex quinquefasciatus]|uniref:DNA replication factor Cdt1 n=1 Tax=Culex quinquefasciatus TaxID=7176 RepID=B0X801_CULQU|nr:DNA replication factor Cdt1 [Culex quinquefasciatus]|eukprot:XP_001865773.1 DNA replication factor Cdt1 [Culex quinquefasciatus]
MSMDQIKAKISRSARLTELKISLNKIQNVSAFNPLQLMSMLNLEKHRSAGV